MDEVEKQFNEAAKQVEAMEAGGSHAGAESQATGAAVTRIPENDGGNIPRARAASEFGADGMDLAILQIVGSPADREFLKTVKHPHIRAADVDARLELLEQWALIRRIQKGEFGGQLDGREFFIITADGVSLLINITIQKVDREKTPAPAVPPELIMADAEFDAILDDLIAKNPRAWLRLIREFSIQLSGAVQNQATQDRELIVGRNKIIAALIIMSRKPAVTLDPLAVSDAEHGTLAFSKDQRGRDVLMFAPTEQERAPILISGDTRVLKTEPPKGNGRRR